jgi:hypothetical protein
VRGCAGFGVSPLLSFSVGLVRFGDSARGEGVRRWKWGEVLRGTVWVGDVDVD